MGEAARKKKLAREKAAAINAAKTPEGMAKERQLYAEGWANGHAAQFEGAGAYAWMAEHVHGFNRILEIGTGDGRGTIALLRAGHSVVSVDENTACLERAVTTIRDAGFECQTLWRGKVSGAADGYSISYDDISLMPQQSSRAILIEGDTLTDDGLLSWLHSIEPFDAVACWLIGSHRARQLNVALPKEDAGSYRLRVQNALHLLSDRVLRPGGVLHIVDRRIVPARREDYELALTDMVRAHADQASQSSLIVDQNVTVRRYEPASENFVRMGLTPGVSGYTPPSDGEGLFSIIARKPPEIR